MLKNIEEQYGIRNLQICCNIAGSDALDETALREPLSGKRDGVDVRINTDACIFLLERDGIPARPTPHINNAPFRTRGKKSMEECAHNLPSPGEPPMRFLESCMHLKLWKLHGKMIQSMGMSKLSLFRDLWLFLHIRKKWWLLPILLLTALLGLILIFAQGSTLAPFIYTVF